MNKFNILNNFQPYQLLSENKYFKNYRMEFSANIKSIHEITNIPKIIHCCMNKKKNIPKEFIDNLKNLNPNYTLKIYDDNDCEKYIEKHNGIKLSNFLKK